MLPPSLIFWRQILSIIQQGLFLDILKKLKLSKTQNSSQIRKKLGTNFQKTQTPLEFSCRNGNQSQKKLVFKTLSSKYEPKQFTKITAFFNKLWCICTCINSVE